eukprot:4823027-Pleurochrysis_carterae.AAC.1
MAHALAGNGARCSAPDFHLVELAWRACVAEGSLPLDKGIKLFDDVFNRLRRAERLRRTQCGAPPLDIGAIVREVIDVDLQYALRADLTAR